MSDRDWFTGEGLPRSLDESVETRRDFSRLSWRLLGIANVDRRDVIEHSDWVRYCAIALFMLVFSLYAFGGWLAFLSTADLDGLGRCGPVVMVVGAVLGAAATLTFDRALVGTTKPKLDYRPPGAVADEGAAGGRAAARGAESLPSVVVKPSPWPIVARVTVAIVVGVFTTQAADLKIFAKDIDTQRRDELV